MADAVRFTQNTMPRMTGYIKRRSVLSWHELLRHCLAPIPFWLMICILLSCIGISILLPFLLFHLFAVLAYPLRGWPHLSKVENIDLAIQELEAECLKVSTPACVKHLTVPIEIGASSISVHVLHVRCKKQKQDTPKIFLVHGTAASSMSFVHLFDPLSQEFDVYAIDLPGFGRTHFPEDFDLEAYVQCNAFETSADLLCEVIDRTLTGLEIKSAVIAGHSFGGYVGIRFAQLYPARTSGLVLMNSAGLFPTLGGYGAHWGCVFKFSIPNVGRRLGSFGYWLMTRLYRNSPEALYWYYLLAHPLGKGDRLVAQRINLTPFSVYWNHPVFHQLGMIPCKVLLIYGADDSIMPPHQGLIAKRIFKDKCELLLVPDQWHNPCSNPKDANLVGSGITAIFGKSETTNEAKSDYIAENERALMDSSTIDIGACQSEEFIALPILKSSFHVQSTFKLVEALYRVVGNVYGEDLTGISPRAIEENGLLAVIDTVTIDS